VCTSVKTNHYLFFGYDNISRHVDEISKNLPSLRVRIAKHSGSDGTLELSTDTQGRIRALASDFPRVWKDPRMSALDRKRMLRLLIDDVTQVRDEEVIHVHIRWKGGATASLEVPRPRLCSELVRTPAAVIEETRGLASEQTDNLIACTLNSRGYRSGTGKGFTASRV